MECQYFLQIFYQKEIKPTRMRRTSVNHLHQRKKTPQGVISLVFARWPQLPKLRKRSPLGKASLATNHSVLSFPCVFARSREPTRMRRTSVNHLHQRKKTPQGVISLVEVVGIEPTSYAAAKILSTYLAYLLFLNPQTRVNTLLRTQKAKYSYKHTFRSL